MNMLVPQDVGAPEAPLPPVQSATFSYTQTESFAPLLCELGASLLISTYQANKLLVARALSPLSPRGRGVGGEGFGLSMLVRTFERPMGMAVDANGLTIGTHNQIWRFRNAPDLARQVEPAGTHDACFLPRSSHMTGDIGVHELAWARNQGSGVRSQESTAFAGLTPDSCLLTPELWIVNTRFSCLCTLHPEYSFVPRWRPPFITALAAEDRCHLNGLAIVDGRPQYVTALGDTDTKDGWRAKKANGGCLMDIPRGATISRGLSMPHSPRWHDGRLWVLESGTGRLLTVDPANGARDTVAELPGFARGLAMCGPYAFIGLSKIRPTSAMDGVPLAQKRDQLKCGISVVDWKRGAVVAFLEFQSAVEEIFDVQLLPNLRMPEVVGFQKDTVQHVFVVPQAGN